MEDRFDFWLQIHPGHRLRDPIRVIGAHVIAPGNRLGHACTCATLVGRAPQRASLLITGLPGFMSVPDADESHQDVNDGQTAVCCFSGGGGVIHAGILWNRGGEAYSAGRRPSFDSSAR